MPNSHVVQAPVLDPDSANAPFLFSSPFPIPHGNGTSLELLLWSNYGKATPLHVATPSCAPSAAHLSEPCCSIESDRIHLTLPPFPAQHANLSPELGAARPAALAV
jgi:hypothetical protein